MRPIKFRQPIWDKDGNFVVFHYWGINIDQNDALVNATYLSFKLNITDPKQSQQFCGFKDCNGRDVYEGDILFCFGTNKVIKFHNGAMGYFTYEDEDFKDFHPIASHNYMQIDNGQFTSIAVIGNIYQTPEKIKNERINN